MAEVFYWQGVIDPGNIQKEYGKTIQKLQEGNLHGLNPEKLADHSVFSIRINRSDRILYTRICVNGKPHLLLLGVVLNHDYEKSRFLKPQVLRNFLECNSNLINQNSTEQLRFEQYDEEPSSSSQAKTTTSDIQFHSVSFFNQKFIQLNEEQQKAITKTEKPLIISGKAGTGKSCVAEALLIHYIEHHHDNGPILFVCDSESLATKTQNDWMALPVAQNLPPDTVQILSYRQLVEQLHPEAKDLTSVGIEYLNNWLNKYIKKNMHIAKTISNQKSFDYSFLNDKDAVYQEFRIISGYNTCEEYKNLGVKQSLFHQNEQKEWLFSAYTAYAQSLKYEGKIHLPFYTINTSPDYKLIVADESQDFSHLQLKTIERLTQNGEICFCEDSSQSLTDNKAKTPFLLGLLGSLWKKVNHITLPFSYRCPSLVLDMANAALTIKEQLTKRSTERATNHSESLSKGQVLWYTKLTDTEQNELQDRAQSPDFAVIVLEEHRDEAQSLFNTPNIFTIEEIKGLEYKHIVAYRLLDAPIYRESNKELIAVQKAQKEPGPKRPGKEHLGPPFNVLYTAFTRATESLIIVQERNHSISHIAQQLSCALPKTLEKSKPSEKTEAHQMQEDWFTQAKILLERGNIRHAKNIFIKKLNKTEAEFSAFHKKYYQPQTQKQVSEQKQTENAVKSTPNQSASTATTSSISVNRVNAIPKINQTKTTIKSKEIEYCENLLENVTSQNLINLFKSKKAQKLLFDVPLKKGNCLFTNLIIHGDKDLVFTFFEVHKELLNDKIADVIFQVDKENNISPFFWLLIENKLLNYLIQKNPMLLANCTDEDLGRVSNKKLTTFQSGTPLYFLTSSRNRIAIFHQVLNGDPGFAKKIRSRDLVYKIPEKLNDIKDTSPLSWLVSIDGAYLVLRQLVELNPDSLNGITAKDLIQEATNKHNDDLHPKSILWFLCKNIELYSIFNLILDKNPEIAKTIPGNALMKYYPHPFVNNGSLNFSALACLSMHSEGVELFERLITANPALLKDLKKEDFFTLCSFQLQVENITCFWLFSFMHSGQVAFINILRSRPELVKDLKFEDLTQVPNFIPEKSKPLNITAISRLAQTATGREIIKIISRENPGFSYQLLFNLKDERHRFFGSTPKESFEPEEQSTSKLIS